MAWVINTYFDTCKECYSTCPKIFKAGLYDAADHVGQGHTTWATPDGRKAGIPIADAASPVQGTNITASSRTTSGYCGSEPAGGIKYKGGQPWNGLGIILSPIIPFSFREFLDYKGIKKENSLSTKKRLIVQKAFEEYWKSGGFPEVLGLSRRLRIKIHQEYFHTIHFRDLVERHDISHPKAVTDLAHRLVDNTASLYSGNSLTRYLKSLGHKVPKTAVSDYLKWFEDAYFLFTVQIFDSSAARRDSNPKRIYCIDHAMATSVASGILVNSGHLLENLVFTALRRLYPQICCYRTRTGREVDFIVPISGKTRILIQACESLAEPQTRKREISLLVAALVRPAVMPGPRMTSETRTPLSYAVPLGRLKALFLRQRILLHTSSLFL